ncbi:MAG: response regulator [Actinomycetota bacterium]|nr:response regulator [Actinomycetota bacterium]
MVAADSGHRTVLVVDADQAIRSLVKLTLDSDATTVHEAADADAAMAAIDEHSVDVAIVDAEVPGGGVDACGRLKRRRRAARTILLVRKGQLDDVDDPQGHVDALLTKPFTSLSLLRKVDGLTT